MSTHDAGIESLNSKPLRSLFALVYVMALFCPVFVNAGTWDELKNNVTKSVSDAASKGVDAVSKGVSSAIDGSSSEVADPTPSAPQSSTSAPATGGLRLNAIGSTDCLKVQPAADDKAMLTNTCGSEILVLISPTPTANSCLQFPIGADKTHRVAYGNNGAVRAVCHSRANPSAKYCKCGE